MKIHLVTLAAFPYTSAESIHLAMFSKAMSEKVDYTLVTPLKPWRKMTWNKRLETIYGLKNNCFKQKKIIQLKKNGNDFITKAIRYAKKENALVYARHYNTMLAAVEKKIYCILELHHLPSNKQIINFRNYISSGYLKKIVVISHALKRDILKIIGDENIYKDYIFVAPDAADESKFSPCLNENEKPTVGYIGSAYKGKGAEIIFPLARACPNIDFVFYGAEYGQKDIEYLGEPPFNLKLKGKILYSQVPEALKTFDIALLPNQLDVIVANGDNIGMYTSPMKLFEYMAAGKVIMASDIDILKEILNKDNSILVDCKDVNEWKTKLLKIYNDEGQRVNLSNAAYRDFIEKYTYNARVNNILKSILLA